MEDLKLFGRQLATLIEQSERMNYLQRTVEKTPDSVMIVDSSERLRYANRQASLVFGMPTGWAEQGELKSISVYRVAALKDGLYTALEGSRYVRAMGCLGDDPRCHGTVICDVIRNWNDQVVGALIHVENQDFLYKVFEALRIVAEADSTDSALRVFLKAAEGLGYPWGRLYVVGEAASDTLVSRLSFGIGDQSVRTKFDEGFFSLPRSGAEASGAWQCIDEGRPLVLQWVQESCAAEVHTKHGLEVTPVSDCPYADDFRKEPGGYWLEIPLGKEGKVTLPLLPAFRPEQLRLLEVLSENVEQLLRVFREREKFAKERDQMILRSAADRALGLTTHNIATRLTALPLVLGRYRLLEEHDDRLCRVNNDFSHVIRECQDFIHRAKYLLAPVEPQVSPFDISEILQSILRTNLQAGQWTFDSGGEAITVEGDRHLLETCLVHFIENSKIAVGDESLLRVSVSIEVEAGSDGNWIRIVFSDNGPGVRTEYKERIFDNFFSIPRPRRKRGLGLGLGFVRRVVEAQGGEVREVGTFGEGARFVIRVPRVASATERRT